METIDRYIGCLVGLAVGDAVGTTVEFKAPGTFEPVTDMVGGGPFGLKPGQWTDDTSMALCLAESLLTCKGFNGKYQMDRYLRWYQDGYLSSTGRCFDIGNTVFRALHKYQHDGNPFAGVADPDSAGNGSLMRLAPVAMYYAHTLNLAIYMATNSSKITHGATTCIDACAFYCRAIIDALSGGSKEYILSPAGSSHYCDSIREVAEGSYKRRSPPSIVGSGYVVKSLEAALWAFYNSTSFKEGCLLAVNLGNDADTTAAIYGQLAGAYYGIKGIPAEWKGKLYKRTMIESMAIRLHEEKEVVR